MTASGNGHVPICGWMMEKTKAILHGPVGLMAVKMLMVQLRTVRNFLLWLFSLLPTDGGMVKAYTVIPGRQRKSCVPAYIRERTGEQESQCGIRKTNRFCLWQAVILQILPIIFLIFTSCLLSGPTRRTDLFSGRQQRQAENT